MEAHIMQDDGRNNQYYYKKAELLEEVYEVGNKCNYHRDKVLKMVHDTIEKRDLMKIAAALAE